MMGEDDRLKRALARFVDPRGRVDIKFGLDRIRLALKKLGDPQELPGRTLHIAGTNGKGSVAAFTRYMCESGGFPAHVFTSPHLVRVNERIRLAGRLVEERALAEALEEAHEAGPDLTYFEALTVAAFILFARRPVIVNIIETGAGGELDSTNVMSNTDVCVITHISRDHEAMFGTSDLKEIARIKAGIMRPGKPVVISHQDDLVTDTLLAAAEDKGAIAFLADRDWSSRMRWGRFEYKDDMGRVQAMKLGLAGPHQVKNAGAACAAVRLLNLDGLFRHDMARGLEKAEWPGRLQKLNAGPITQKLGNARVVLDGAHNPDAAEVLGDVIRQISSKTGVKPCILMAMQANKDIEKIVAPIAEHAHCVISCPLPSDHGQEGQQGADPELIASLVTRYGGHGIPVASLDDALEMMSGADHDDYFVCGSLYLVGEMLKRNNQLPD